MMVYLCIRSSMNTNRLRLFEPLSLSRKPPTYDTNNEGSPTRHRVTTPPPETHVALASERKSISIVQAYRSGETSQTFDKHTDCIVVYSSCNIQAVDTIFHNDK